MQQSRSYVCTQCASPVPSRHKFCGACGASVPEHAQNLTTECYGALQAPGRARLLVIRSDGSVGEGTSYVLQAAEHDAGREAEQIPMPTDQWLNLRHATFIYRGSKLVVRDEGSLNGVYVRIQVATSASFGDRFLCGDQVFRIDATPKDASGPDGEQTYFYSSPRRPSPFRVTQILDGGMDGMCICARDSSVTIGRENCDMNFPEDIHMSVTHARIELTGEDLQISDTESQNGVFMRIRGEQELHHGDYLFMGKHLLRVEVTT